MELGLSLLGFNKVDKTTTDTKTTTTNTTDKTKATTLSTNDAVKLKDNIKADPAFTSKNPLINRVGEMFKTIDTNKDGILTKTEIISKLNDPTIKGKDAAIVGSLLKYEPTIKKLSDDQKMFETGITVKDMLAADNKIDKDGLTSKFENEIAYKSSKIDSVKTLRNKDESLKPPTKASEVNYQDLQQGQNGNCYFLAVLTSVAHNNPQKVVDMIKDNKDGTLTVKFPLREVTIKSPTDTELSLYAKGKTWVPIIEKAYAEYRNTFLDFDNPHQASGKGTLIIGRAILEVTGNSFDSDFTAIRPLSVTREKMTKAFDNNKIVTASIEKPILGSKNDLNLPDGHVYSVLGYDKKTDVVTVRNPWGSGEPTKDQKVLDGTNDGVFKMPLAEFVKYFSMVAYEN